MSKFDRCEICDYTENNGSALTGAVPGENGNVLFSPNLEQLLCRTCRTIVAEQGVSIGPLKDVGDPIEKDPPIV